MEFANQIGLEMVDIILDVFVWLHTVWVCSLVLQDSSALWEMNKGLMFKSDASIRFICND